MRILPKKTKGNYIWKGLDFGDIIALLILSIILILAVLTNIEAKWYIVAAICVIWFVAFQKIDEVRIYKLIGYSLLYLIMPKKLLSHGETKANICGIVEMKEIVPAGYLKLERKNGLSFAKAIRVKDVLFTLLTEDAQNDYIEGLSKVLNLLEIDQKMQLIKVEQPIIFDEFIQEIDSQRESIKNNKKLSKKEIESRLNILQVREDTLQSLNEDRVIVPVFYVYYMVKLWKASFVREER